MILHEHYILRQIRKLTLDTERDLILDLSTGGLCLFTRGHATLRSGDYEKTLPLKLDIEDANTALICLENKGYIVKRARLSSNYFSFSISHKTKHLWAYWFEAFSKRFWCGFLSGAITGIIATVAGGLLLAYIRARLGI